MADDWIDAAASALPHIPGFAALGVAALSFFRAGRGVGRVESAQETYARDVEDLKSRVAGAERLGADLTIKLAEVPNRSEVRSMFAEAREDTRAIIGELREDLREMRRG